MSQHLIHVCVTDAPAWSQRERGKSEKRRKSKQSRTGKREVGKGEGNTTEQMRRRERGESRQENRDPVNQISQDNKTKERGGSIKGSPLPLLWFGAQRLLLAMGKPHIPCSREWLRSCSGGRAWGWLGFWGQRCASPACSPNRSKRLWSPCQGELVGRVMGQGAFPQQMKSWAFRLAYGLPEKKKPFLILKLLICSRAQMRTALSQRCKSAELQPDWIWGQQNRSPAPNLQDGGGERICFCLAFDGLLFPQTNTHHLLSPLMSVLPVCCHGNPSRRTAAEAGTACQPAALTRVSNPMESTDAGVGGRENSPRQTHLFLSLVTKPFNIPLRLHSPELIWRLMRDTNCNCSQQFPPGFPPLPLLLAEGSVLLNSWQGLSSALHLHSQALHTFRGQEVPCYI